MASAAEVSDEATCCVVDVDSGNWLQMWPCISLAIKTASFVSIDTEMSGIGIRKRLMSKDIQDRYLYMREIAKSRSILSIGLACFKPAAPKASAKGGEGKGVRVDGPSALSAQVFNISLLSECSYMVEPSALKFLHEHGFNFNKQIGAGVPYLPSGHEPVVRHTYNKKKKDKADADGRATSAGTRTCSPRDLFACLVESKVELIVHNGLLDFAFLYEGLHGELPSKLAVFVANLQDMFPCIIDTKYVAEFVVREPASFLEYLFRKHQRSLELAPKGEEGTRAAFIDFPLMARLKDRLAMDIVVCPARHGAAADAQTAHCGQYAAHGHCDDGQQCPKSHDLDLVLDREEQASNRKKRKRELGVEGDDDGDEADGGQALVVRGPNLHTARSQGHRAGFDAFMTGYIAASMQHRAGGVEGMAPFTNKLFLSGKPRPLLLQKSRSFASHAEDASTPA